MTVMTSNATCVKLYGVNVAAASGVSTHQR